MFGREQSERAGRYMRRAHMRDAETAGVGGSEMRERARAMKSAICSMNRYRVFAQHGRARRETMQAQQSSPRLSAVRPSVREDAAATVARCHPGGETNLGGVYARERTKNPS